MISFQCIRSTGRRSSYEQHRPHGTARASRLAMVPAGYKVTTKNKEGSALIRDLDPQHLVVLGSMIANSLYDRAPEAGRAASPGQQHHVHCTGEMISTRLIVLMLG